MDPWWPLLLAAYWGISFGLLGSQYAESDRAVPQPFDWLIMLTVGPLILGWVCICRFRRHHHR